MAYCDSSDVERYCTPSEGTDLSGAIAYATDTIDAYTRDKHEPLDDQELLAVVGRSGVAYLPFTARAVSSVYETDSGREVDSDLYAFTAGRKAAIRMTGNPAWNLLVKGREPWATADWNGTRLTVTADLGPAETPAAVREAAAILAALHLVATGQATGSDALSGFSAKPDGVAAITVEGFSVSYTTGTDATTGVPTVDRLLAPYRRIVARWS